ncbi:hypothetical protein GJ496_010589 [Pomphorhynchus laevis]|nr:hypothetical protein GJ496_010589 [Pomphorhynchus laevis]
MSGGNSAPSESDFKIFARIVDRFLLKNPNGTIGVHCTHGLNRTGYMICRYMMEKWAISADDAIGRFKSGRGYKITREQLVAALRLIERRQIQERSFSYSFD